MIRIPAVYLTLALMIASAALVTAAIWLAFALLASMAQYVPSGL